MKMAVFTCLLGLSMLMIGLSQAGNLSPREDTTSEASSSSVPPGGPAKTPEASPSSILSGDTTVAATTTVVGDPNCRDNITNCLSYGHPSCTGPYEDWAKVHCAAFCGFCIPITSPFICEDKITNCNEYGDDLCTNQGYVGFVEKNCLKHCHMCPGELTSPPPKTGCFDDFERCDEFGKATCTGYPSWSQLYCAKYCNFCQSNETSEATTAPIETTTQAMTTPDDPCFDRRDCSGFDIHTSCCGQYEAFSRYNCAKHCRFCTPKVPEFRQCNDTIPNCDQYNADLCTNREFENFVKTKCAGYCKVCDKPLYKPPCAGGASGSTEGTTVATTPPAKQCNSKGKSYSKGESWHTEGCYQTCECQDPDTNQIKCGPLKCPEAQRDCDLIYIPGACCPVLKCSFLQVVHGERTQEELAALMIGK